MSVAHGVERSHGFRQWLWFWLLWTAATTAGLAGASALSGFFLDSAPEELRLVMLLIGGVLGGLILGGFQLPLLRPKLERPGRWILWTWLGWLLAMVPLATRVVFGRPAFGMQWLLPALGGGLIAGAALGMFQWLELRRHVPRAGWWILASAAAWGLGALVIQFLRGLPLSWTGIALILAGEIVVAMVTGVGLVLLVDRSDQRLANGIRLAGLAAIAFTAAIVLPFHLSTQQRIILQELGTESVYAVAFSPDGSLLATAGYSQAGGGHVTLWDPVSGRRLRSFANGSALSGAMAFTPDGSQLVTGAWKISPGSTVTWDVASGAQLRQIGSQAITFALSPDGSLIATGGGDHEGGELKLWDAATGEALHTFVGHTHMIYSVAFSRDGKRLASAGLDGNARVWDVDRRALMRTLTGGNAEASVAFTPDGQLLLTGGANSYLHEDPNAITLRSWDIESGILHGTMDANQTVECMAISPDQTLVAVGYGILERDYQIDVFDLVDGNLITSLSGHTGSLYGLAFSPDGRMLASASSDGTARLWDVEQMSGAR